MQHASNVIGADFAPPHHPPPERAKKWRRVWINKKLLVVAIFVEAVIIAAVLYAGWQFGERFSGGNATAWWTAIVGSIVYAAVECARVPLAMTAASHRHRFTRILAVLTLLGAVFITTKSLSQVGQQMYSYRLVAVTEAQTALEKAKAGNAGAIETNSAKHERIKALDAEVVRLTAALEKFLPIPPAREVCSTRRTRRGPERICKLVTPAWAGATIQKQLEDARARRNAMDVETAATGKARDAAQAAIADAQGAYDVAVMNSQLHSFAAMLFLKAPSQVTDDEVHALMLLFVLVGGFAGAVTATGLAYCCFTRYPALDEPDFDARKKRAEAVALIPTIRALIQDILAGKEARKHG